MVSGYSTLVQFQSETGNFVLYTIIFGIVAVIIWSLENWRVSLFFGVIAPITGHSSLANACVGDRLSPTHSLIHSYIIQSIVFNSVVFSIVFNIIGEHKTMQDLFNCMIQI